MQAGRDREWRQRAVDPALAVSRGIAGYLAAAGRAADVDGIAKIQVFDDRATPSAIER